MAKNQSVKNVKNVEKSEKQEKVEKSKKQRQQKDFEAIQPKFIDKLINSYNINVLDEQYQKPIASLKQLPVVFAKLYLLRDKEDKNSKENKENNDNKENKKDTKIKPADKFAKIISEVKGIQTCSNVKLMKLKYLQNAKLISKKISEQFESEYQEFLTNYEMTADEVPKGKTRKVQVIATFKNQNSEEMQEQIRLNNVNKCMMSFYKLVTDSLSEELKDKTDESEIVDIYKTYIKEQLAVEEEKPTEFQKTYSKYEALLNGSIEPEQEYKLKQTFMKLWTAHKKEWKIPELKMGYQVAIASAELLNKIMQEWQDKIRIIYLTKQYDVNSKLLVSEFGKEKKEKDADKSALNKELNEQKQQNIQDNIEALVGKQSYPLTIEYQIEDKDIKPREPKEKTEKKDKKDKKDKKSKKEEKEESEEEQSEEPKKKSKSEKKDKKDKKDKKSKKEEKEESEEQEMSDVVDSILDEQKEESEEPKVEKSEKSEEVKEKKHKKSKKDKSEKKSGKKDEE